MATKNIFTTIIVLLLAAAGAGRAQGQPITTESSIEIADMADRAKGNLSDTTYWHKEGTAALNLSQASFSNWVAGGTPSIAFDAGATYTLNHSKDRTLWTNRLELAYGINNTEDNGTRKTNDKIYLSSNYGYLIAPKLYAGSILTFNSQFYKGYDYKVSSTVYTSRFMAPGYLSVGIGLTWIPRKWLSVTFSPAMWRGTFVLDDALSDAGAYGVKPGHDLYNEFGASLKAEADATLWKSVSLYSRLSFYSNYLKNPQNIDIRWDTQIRIALSKMLTASLNVNMLYDDDIKFIDADGTEHSSRLQVKQIAGIGLQMKF